MERTKDLRKVINADMKSYGKVVEVVWSSGYDCEVVFKPGGKSYFMSRLSLDRLSDSEYDLHNHLFGDTPNVEVSDAGSPVNID
jgi:hypothetical protein